MHKRKVVLPLPFDIPRIFFFFFSDRIQIFGYFFAFIHIQSVKIKDCKKKEYIRIILYSHLPTCPLQFG